MADPSEAELCDEGLDYAFRKNGIRPTAELKSDVKWTMINVLAQLIAKHDLSQIEKTIAPKNKKKRRQP